MGFVLDWQKKLGYKKDPFTGDPSERIHDFFINRERERELINLFIIKRARFGIVQGAKGSGKSALFRWVADELEHHGLKGNVFFYADETLLSDKNAFFDDLLAKSMNLLERKLMKPQESLSPAEREELLAKKLAKRHLLIIVDNAQTLAAANLDLLKKLLDSCPDLQVVLGLERILKAHEALGDDALGITLEEMTDKDLTLIVETRIRLAGGSGTFPFDEEELQRLISSAKKSPVKLLELCRERAIELSLKADAPPKAAEKTPKERPASKKSSKKVDDEDIDAIVKAAAKEAKESPKEEKRLAEPQQKKKWFSIKFVKEDDLKEQTAFKKQRELDAAVSEEAEEEAELLDKVLAPPKDAVETIEEKNGEKKEAKKQKKEELKMDDMIETVVKETESKRPPIGKGAIIKSKRR